MGERTSPPRRAPSARPSPLDGEWQRESMTATSGWTEGLGSDRVILAQGSQFVENIRTARDVDHRNERVLPAHQPNDRGPIARSGHLHVGDEWHEGDWRTLEKRRRLVAILGLTDCEAGVGENLGQDETDQRFIFNNQNAQGLPGAPLGTSPLLGLIHWPWNLLIAPYLISVQAKQYLSTHTIASAMCLEETTCV
jgi:hypothetical protein